MKRRILAWAVCISMIFSTTAYGVEDVNQVPGNDTLVISDSVQLTEPPVDSGRNDIIQIFSESEPEESSADETGTDETGSVVIIESIGTGDEPTSDAVESSEAESSSEEESSEESSESASESSSEESSESASESSSEESSEAASESCSVESSESASESSSEESSESASESSSTDTSESTVESSPLESNAGAGGSGSTPAVKGCEECGGIDEHTELCSFFVPPLPERLLAQETLKALHKAVKQENCSKLSEDEIEAVADHARELYYEEFYADSDASDLKYANRIVMELSKLDHAPEVMPAIASDIGKTARLKEGAALYQEPGVKAELAEETMTEEELTVASPAVASKATPAVADREEETAFSENMESEDAGEDTVDSFWDDEAEDQDMEEEAEYAVVSDPWGILEYCEVIITDHVIVDGTEWYCYEYQVIFGDWLESGLYIKAKDVKIRGLQSRMPTMDEYGVVLCDCGYNGDGGLELHADGCARKSWTKEVATNGTVEMLWLSWENFPEDVQDFILVYLTWTAWTKYDQLLALVPIKPQTLEYEMDGVTFQVSGPIPAGVTLSVEPVAVDHYHAGIYEYMKEDGKVYFAYDITLRDSMGSLWQPRAAEHVEVTFDATSMGLEEYTTVRVLHDHGGIQDVGVSPVLDGKLSFRLGGFSGVYGVETLNVEQNVLNNIVYFDLSAGDVKINGSSYTGARYDGNESAKVVSGMLKDNEIYYVYQSDGVKETGLLPNALGEVTLTIPQRDHVQYEGKTWGEYITGNSQVDTVIAAWNEVTDDTRVKTPYSINFSNSPKCDMVIDGIYSSLHYGGRGVANAQSRTSGGISLPLSKCNGTKVKLLLKGDNRVGNIYYYAFEGNQLIFDDYNVDETVGTLTVANLVPGEDTNWWNSAIGGSDHSENANEIVIEGGIIYAGTTVGDDCTAIGAGGNGYAKITIKGGKITAVSSSSGAAIGGGIGKTSPGGNADIYINGGTIYAYNFSCTGKQYSNYGVEYIPAAAIGGGSSAANRGNAYTNITITGGDIFARSVGGTAIGGGSSADLNGGASTIKISGGTVDAASIPGTVTYQGVAYDVPAGASIGGGTGGVAGNGGNTSLTVSGKDTKLITGSIGGGKTTNPTGLIGNAVVKIENGTIQGQVIMAAGAAADCSFEMTGGLIDNSQDTAEDDYHFMEANGGAVYVQNGTAALKGGTIQEVKAVDGGAIYVTGTDAKSGSFEMTGGTIQNSEAQRGGAIYVAKGTCTISGGDLLSNEATKDGGAIYVAGGTCTVKANAVATENPEIRGNEATENGGAVYVANGTCFVNNGTVSGNTASVDGGGIYVAGGTCTMAGGILSSNQATGNGGSVYVTKVGSADSTFSMTGGTIEGGTVTGSNAQNGGAVYVANGTCTVSDGTVKENKASNDGGGIYVAGGTCTMNGGMLNGNTATKNGGAVYVTKSGDTASQFKMTDGDITTNLAQNGGAVYMNGGTCTMSNLGEMTGNIASVDGGGIYVAGGICEMTGGTVSGNRANRNGGGVYVADGTCNVKGGTIAENQASDDGGGVYVAGGTCDMDGGMLEGNRAAYNGGGAYVTNGTYSMSGGTISGGTLETGQVNAQNGGGVYIVGGSCELSGGTLTGNKAHEYGGAVYVKNTSVNFGGTGTGISITNNTATDGAGLYILQDTKPVSGDKYTTSVTTGTISGNIASGDGGGLYHTGSYGSCTVSGTSAITNNQASNGGALYIISGSHLEVAGGIITANHAVGTPAGVKTAYYDASNKGVGGGVYVGAGASVDSSFKMQSKNAGIYLNEADFAANDVYANEHSTVLDLPAVNDMQLTGSDFQATGWFEDYVDNDTMYVEFGLKNASAGHRYDEKNVTYEAKIADIALGKYVCLTVGKKVVNYGKIIISKEGTTDAADQIFVFLVESTELSDTKLPEFSFEVTVKGAGSVEIVRVPYGKYKVTELTDWSWRHAPEAVQKEQAFTIDTTATKSIVVKDSLARDKWLDGNSETETNAFPLAERSKTIAALLDERKEEGAA